MRKYLVPGLILLIIAGLVGLGLFLLNNSQPPTSLPYNVRRGALNAVVRTTGKVEPGRSTRLAFRSSDTVKKIYVKPGDKVAAGILLAELDDSRLQRELVQAEAQRDITRLGLSGGQERNRYQAATAPTPSASPAATPTLPPDFTPSASPIPIPPVSDQYVPVKQAEQAEQAALQARANLENARLYAPYDGTVLTVEASEGDTVGQGTTFITFADLSGLQVRADIDEIDVANVASGQNVQFSLDAFPGRSFEGRINSLAPAATQRQGSTVYAAIVGFGKAPGVAVRPGMAASLTIISLTKNNILIVPNRAIKTIGSRKYVAHYTDESHTEDVAVETGLTSGDQTEIVTGLNEGEKIALPR